MLDFICMRPVGLIRTTVTREHSENKNRRPWWGSNQQTSDQQRLFHWAIAFDMKNDLKLIFYNIYNININTMYMQNVT